MKIAIIGTGYVGLGTGAVFADLGNEVIGVDIDAAKVALLQSGTPHIFEPGLAELLARNLKAGRLRFTTDYAAAVPDAELVFICVGTPAGPHGGADMRHVRAAARAVGGHLTPGRRTIVVNKSTMPIGSGDLVGALLSEEAPAGARFAVVSNPEFLREGSAVRDMQHPDRIVLGSTDRGAAEAVAAIYQPFDAPVLITDLRTAEMIKYASNAFLATKISFINEVAAVCEATGADVRQVAAGMGLDPRIGPQFLAAGIGFGGSCFPKDVQALEFMAEEANCHPQLLRAVLEINRDGRRAFVRKLDRLIGGLEGKTVAIWGLAFKPNTDDLREAAALEIIADILARGGWVRAYDPAAMDGARATLASPRVAFCADAYEAANGVDAVALVTEWNEFKGLDLARVRDGMRAPILLDGRNLYDPRELAQLGFTYRGVGLPTSADGIDLPEFSQIAPAVTLAIGDDK
ncbi:MAG: UDP-glucose 6-dehydrogenase [uncultured Thermomicrobiales bacterium]|uniref:UDP-glucose 6-dehydrogenase n=1 Tax=uncultured Thermomicrobiales bacterium TaxID=1645740 RepID=A0A6J4VW01_9BACT|nr:MAG: UDP-glucose 6-dehydrogenase [uncultured Thermomicrobiales bacterium]